MLFRDCKIFGVEFGSGLILIPVCIHIYQVWKRTRAAFFSPDCGVCTEDLYSFVQKGALATAHTHEHEQTVKSCSYFSRCPDALIYWPEFSSCCLRCRKNVPLFSCLISETSMMSPSASLMRPEFRLTADFFKEFFSRPLFFFLHET